MPRSSSVPAPVVVYVHRFKVAAGPNERVAVMRSMAAELGPGQVVAACTEIARDVFAPSMESIYGTVHWRDEFDAPFFEEVYAQTAGVTDGFRYVTVDGITACITADPRTLLVFRLIVGYTRDELSDATEAVDPGHRVSKSSITTMEQGGTPRRIAEASDVCAKTIDALMTGALFPPMPEGSEIRTKQQKFDTADGWESVRRLAETGVPYEAYLHQRMFGGAFRQLADSTSSRVGDVIEDALIGLLEGAGLAHVQAAEDLPRIDRPAFIKTTSPGVDKEEVARRFGITLTIVPDFVVFHRLELKAFIECKYTSDGGTAREKAARFQRYQDQGQRLSVPMFAAIGGRGFRDRLADGTGVILRVCEGRVFSTSDLPMMLSVNPFPNLLQQVPRT